MTVNRRRRCFERLEASVIAKSAYRQFRMEAGRLFGDLADDVFRDEHAAAAKSEIVFVYL
jgi:hypothetical protein